MAVCSACAAAKGWRELRPFVCVPLCGEVRDWSTRFLPRSIYQIVAGQATEAIYTLLDYSSPGTLTEDSQRSLAEALRKADAMVLGCGLSTNRESSALFRQCLMGAEKPIVIDADGINLLARNIDILKTVQAPLVLTPHPGEMARLTGRSVAEIQLHRLESAVSLRGSIRWCWCSKGRARL